MALAGCSTAEDWPAAPVPSPDPDPDDAEVNAHLGDAFYAAGLRLQADYQWQRALALKPDAKLQAEITSKLKQVQPPA